MNTPQPISIYQLKLTLKGCKPPIWRRIQISSTTTLTQLHQTLQIVMGWTDSHLHQFIVGDVYYGAPDPEWEEEVKNETQVQLGQIVTAVNDQFIYEYDFGDGWTHEIIVEKLLSPKAHVHYPICLAGKRACPPEDVGGVWGYAEFVEAIRAPTHPEHKRMRQWAGGSFDPEAFDRKAINQALKQG